MTEVSTVDEGGGAIKMCDATGHGPSQLCADVDRKGLKDTQHDRNDEEEALHGRSHVAKC